MGTRNPALSLYRLFALLLLLFNGAGAIYGGGSFILSPDGALMHIDTSLLVHTPFSSFLIPGIVLFIFNGLTSLAIAILTLIKAAGYSTYVLLQGVLLLGWLIIEVVMIREINMLHYIMALVAIGLIICGVAIKKYSGTPKTAT